MNVLVACEFSGIVRDAFAKRGHYAISVDLLATERPGHHYQGRVEDFLSQTDTKFDLMIAHPPCTYLTNANAKNFAAKRTEQREALNFVKYLLNVDIPRIALENPVGIISTRIRPHNQIIHPWEFGHQESKPTCLWLRNLPPLKQTKIERERVRRIANIPQRKDRWKIRSRTYIGIAEAMAEQWGNL